jgi:hypothetical protein
VSGQGVLHYTGNVGRTELMKSGPLIQAAWTLPKRRLFALHAASQSEPQPVQGLMLIDTGAQGLLIDAGAANELGLQRTGRITAGHGLTGHSDFVEYEATLMLPLTDRQGVQGWKGFPVCPWLMPDSTLFQTDENSSRRVIGVIGRLLLQFTTFVYDGLHGNYELRIDMDALLAKGRAGR